MGRTQAVISLGEDFAIALRFLRFRRPQSVLLAVPTHLKQREKEYRKQLSRYACTAVEVSSSDFNLTRRRLRQALLQERAKDVEFCVSSGPLAVRTAAVQLAREYGHRATHVTLQEDLLLHDVFRPEAGPEVAYNTLDCYLAARGVRMGSRYPLVGSPYDDLAEYLVAHREVWSQVITPLRTASGLSDMQAGGKSLSLDLARLQGPHQDLLQKLQEFGIISRVARAQGVISFHITEDNWNYINGHWLEVFVWQRLAGLFDDCSCGQHLTTPQGTREIDFVGLQDGHFVLVSCKTAAQSYDPAHLMDLQSLSQQMHEPNCLRFYVTDRFQSSHQPGPAYEDFVSFARSESIDVIFGDNLNNIREIVSQRLAQHQA